ncbi:MAG: tripartite tricarboxylate transporter substrate binding protein [Proteobacteria bacterium]|nr:tripartite tricarboxylate transporter substrate binding protein [Pseudomonadota bacterium]
MNVTFLPAPRRLVRRALLAALLPCLAGAALAADVCPGKTIKLIVPYPAGGTTDVMARTIAEALAPRLGKTVLVDNRGGAGGMTGTDQALKSAPDGCTYLVGLATSMLVNQYLYGKLPYDPQKDQALVTQIAVGPLVLLASPKLPVNSAPELLRHIEANKGQLAYGSWGMGSTAHLDGAWLSDKLKADMNHVPYKGEAAMLQDMVGGQFHIAFAALQSARPFIESGRLKALGVTGTERLAALPKVPTLLEQGIKDDVFRVTGWVGMSAPAKTPAAAVSRMAAEVHAILAQPEMRERFQQMGFIAVGNTPEEFRAVVQKDGPVWERVVKLSGAKLD